MPEDPHNDIHGHRSPLENLRNDIHGHRSPVPTVVVPDAREDPIATQTSIDIDDLSNVDISSVVELPDAIDTDVKEIEPHLNSGLCSVMEFCYWQWANRKENALMLIFYHWYFGAVARHTYFPMKTESKYQKKSCMKSLKLQKCKNRGTHFRGLMT